MSWSTPFVIYRFTADARVEEVFSASDIQKVKYWLTYIAQPGDLLCRTPIHPKHSKGTSTPEYYGHKEDSGKPSWSKEEWEKFIASKMLTVKLPESQSPQQQS